MFMLLLNTTRLSPVTTGVTRCVSLCYMLNVCAMSDMREVPGMESQSGLQTGMWTQKRVSGCRPSTGGGNQEQTSKTVFYQPAPFCPFDQSHEEICLGVKNVHTNI